MRARDKLSASPSATEVSRETSGGLRADAASEEPTIRPRNLINSSFDSKWPLAGAVLTLWAVLALALWRSLSANDWHLIYPLDDPYIHMAIAKNLILHHVWGVTRYGFTSASSSPLWTAIVAVAYSVVGVGDVSPLALNVVLGTALLLVVGVLVRSAGLNPREMFLVLLAIMFATPVPALVFCGQEHVLHTLLTIVFLEFAVRTLAEDGQAPARAWPLIAIAPFLVMSRYEGIALVAVVGGLLALRRRVALAAGVVVVAALPVCGFGLISMANGWDFLPSSVLLKANLPDAFSGGVIARAMSRPFENLMLAPHLLIIGGLAVAVLLTAFRADAPGGIWNRACLRLELFLAILAAHVCFASVGWFFRYEAYLVATGLYALACCLHEPWVPSIRAKFDGVPTRRLVFRYLVALAVVIPLVIRAVLALEIRTATHEIYTQQYQTGRFVRRFYSGQALALNDIGAVDYFADIRLVDLFGLADMEVASARLAGALNGARIDDLAHHAGARVAILYPAWFDGRYAGPLPAEWIRVGEWRVPDKFVIGSDTVAFYAIDPQQAPELRSELAAFSTDLPAGVIATIPSDPRR